MSYFFKFISLSKDFLFPISNYLCLDYVYSVSFLLFLIVILYLFRSLGLFSLSLDSIASNHFLMSVAGICPLLATKLHLLLAPGSAPFGWYFLWAVISLYHGTGTELGLLALSWGLFGLVLEPVLFLEEATVIEPSGSSSRETATQPPLPTACPLGCKALSLKAIAPVKRARLQFSKSTQNPAVSRDSFVPST